MSKERKDCSSHCSRLSQLALIGVNVAFVAIGILLIYFGIKTVESGWPDVFQDEFPWMDTASFWAIIFFGGLVILIASIGFWGACSKNRCLLKAYLIFVIFALVLFFLITYATFASTITAKKWKTQNYPASNTEKSIASNFNSAYCLSYGVYYCNQGTISEIAGLIDMSTIQTSTLDTFSSSGIKGINGVCELLGKVQPDIRKQVDDICKVCKKTEPFDKYNKVNLWAEDACPISESKSSMKWCLNFLFKKKTSDEYSETPYQPCRPSFLQFWIDKSTIVGTIGVIVCGITIGLIIFTLCIRQSEKKQESYNQI